MERWARQFDDHAFQEQWKELKKLANDVEPIAKETKESIDEHAHLYGSITRIDGWLKIAQSQFTPIRVWDKFYEHATICIEHLSEYKQNKDIGFIQSANDEIDTIIFYVRPYITDGPAARTAGKAFGEYNRAIQRRLGELETDGKPILSGINKIKANSDATFEGIKASEESIKKLENELLNDSEGKKSLQSRAHESFEQIKKWQAEASKKLTMIRGEEEEEEEEEGEENIISKIKKAIQESNEDRNAIAEILKTVTEQINDFKNYHSDVFGKEQEDGTVAGGLQKELEIQMQNLTDNQIKQVETHDKLRKEIEQLLSGATSAGLARSYAALRKESKGHAYTYTKWFIISLVALFGMSLILFIWLYIDFTQSNDIRDWLPNLIFRLPILAPILWVSLFFSKRRSELYRLQQEYAHKEAVAKSYHNFKVQIEKLDRSDPELMKQLIEAAIKAIGSNASKTLDGNHGDKMPAHEVLENFMNDKEPSKVIEALKRLKPQ